MQLFRWGCRCCRRDVAAPLLGPDDLLTCPECRGALDPPRLAAIAARYGLTAAALLDLPTPLVRALDRAMWEEP